MSLDLLQLQKYARERHIPVMLDDTKQLLFDTVSSLSPKRILEIGTAIGYSGIVMLSASPCATLNTVELDERTAEIARSNFDTAQLSSRVNIFVGDAREIVQKLTGKYDFIFLDGPKGQYLAFLPYLTDVLEIGGTLFCDNVLYKGLVENIPQNKRHKHITVARNMHAFLEEITQSPRYKTTLHRVGDGVSISQKLY
ncbi:MAG: O-methyltransferase [Corallococcus sp.]|nr:O-methyltransferase [Corallococcus sp.]MCM1359654.1 O-methyltransferase [Corallococcus sp.]MCM1395363.1 O-methyltransferase [Corallococcus sp.]